MKKQKLSKLKLSKKVISNLQSDAVTGGGTITCNSEVTCTCQPTDFPCYIRTRYCDP